MVCILSCISALLVALTTTTQQLQECCDESSKYLAEVTTISVQLRERCEYLTLQNKRFEDRLGEKEQENSKHIEEQRELKKKLRQMEKRMVIHETKQLFLRNDIDSHATRVTGM